MHIILLTLIVLIVILGPSIWVSYVLKKYAVERSDFPGTGGELATHLLNRFGLPTIKVEVTDAGDHYDPGAKAVRLSQQNFSGKSLTAAVTAAHEVGHALQDKSDYPPFIKRQTFVKAAFYAEKMGGISMILVPLLAGVFRAPGMTLLAILLGVVGLGIQVLAHLTTLPVEYDASFNRALPILAEGEYLSAEDLANAHTILKACALTYVANALRNMLNFAYWIRLLRR